MKVLILGAKGQVGFSLRNILACREDIEIIAYDRDELDIANSYEVSQMIRKISPQFIINAAAYTMVDKAEEDISLCYAANSEGPKNLAIAAKQNGSILLHISTDYVFDGTNNSPYIETDKTAPNTVYGKSKLAGELAVIDNCSEYIILRTAWVFGENGHNFVKTMLKLARTRNELSITGDQFGGPTYAGDIAEALVTILNKFLQGSPVLSGVYHFSGLPHVSWYEFASEIISQATNNEIIDNPPTVNCITTEQYPTLALRPENSRLNCDKIYTVFKIRPSDWRKALRNIKEYT